jgi:Zn-dependent peptidase ImmA (M78 family)
MRDDYKMVCDLGLTPISQFTRVFGNLLDVLSILPEDVYQFVINNITFYDAKSQCDTIDPKKKWLIILHPKASKFRVAHEIAHAWLKHDYITFPHDERAAHQQAKNWLSPKQE